MRIFPKKEWKMEDAILQFTLSPLPKIYQLPKAEFHTLFNHFSKKFNILLM